MVRPDCKEARSDVLAENLSHSIEPQLKPPPAPKEKLENKRTMNKNFIFSAQELSPEQVCIFQFLYKSALEENKKNKLQ